MKVAEEKTIRFERRIESVGGMVIPAPGLALGSVKQDDEQDVRSLITAVAMCVACWVVLGYYLLT
ncbi:hypothetical protein WBP07_07355 [Novosphingobium sp. BL-8A]|uniref:hypothetical protein n=1 Tax=Novosphingobium sp. BL-8A TaxID=3127639 RepID=UPI0037563946